MKNWLKKIWNENPRLRKILAIVLIILGLISIITPFTPFGFLLIIGLEIIGLRVLLWDKLKLWIKKRPPQ